MKKKDKNISTEAELAEKPVKKGRPGRVVLIVLAVLLLLGGAGAAYRYAINDRLLYEDAVALFDAGDYEGAKAIFLTLDYEDSVAKVTECNYAMARELYDSGDRDAAKAAFEALGDYSDSAEMVLQCRYLDAADVYATGDWFAAEEAFLALGDYSDAPAQAAQCRRNAYEQAMQDMILSEFEAAEAALARLGDYEDSEMQLANCRERLAAEAAFEKKEILVDSRYVERFDEGDMYIHPLGYVYVPDKVSENTAWMVYFPGGCGSGRNLSLESVWQEHTLFNPDAVMIWLYDNGFWNIPDFVQNQLWPFMQQVAVECDIWFHDLATTGSSNGVYPAIMACSELYRVSGLKIENVLAFDAGMDWDIMECALLNEEQCELLAEAGSTVFLMEQHDFTEYFTEIEPVMDMVKAGADIIAVECTNDGHNNIGPDAIRAGGMQFIINESDWLTTEGLRFWKLFADGSFEHYECSID